MSQQGKLLRYIERRRAGKTVAIKAGGVVLYHFEDVTWGGASPMVCLRELATGERKCKSAAEWKRLGVAL